MILRSQEMPIREEGDVVRIRQAMRTLAAELGFSLVDQTKLVTAASEIARNTLVHGKGGSARIEVIQELTKKGVRLTCEDKGPGIADLALAMKDGWTSGGGLGLGLGGAKRLVNDFDLKSAPGEGTVVVITRWK